MSNKTRNWEAVNINRALITGQAQSVTEAAVNWFIKAMFGIDLSRPMREGTMWIRQGK
jgi:hypothetical protein